MNNIYLEKIAILNYIGGYAGSKKGDKLGGTLIGGSLGGGLGMGVAHLAADAIGKGKIARNMPLSAARRVGFGLGVAGLLGGGAVGGAAYSKAKHAILGEKKAEEALNKYLEKIAYTFEKERD